MLSCFLVEETTEVAVLAFAPVVFRRGMKKARSDNVNLRARLVAVAGTTLQERRISAIKAARQSKLNASRLNLPAALFTVHVTL